MKRYIPVLIGIVALCAIIYLWNGREKEIDTDDFNTSGSSTMSVSGNVVRIFEGENILKYAFDIPDMATTTVERDGALIKVINGDTIPLVMYASYEGGRGYSASDYISNKIVPAVAAVTDSGTTTIGSYEWNVVQSERSVWYVGKVGSGQWLLVSEFKKSDADVAHKILESLTTE